MSNHSISNYDAIKHSQRSSSPVFKSMLKLLFISLFLLLAGQSQAELIDDAHTSDSAHSSYSGSLTSPSSPELLTLTSGTDSQLSSPTFEDKPRMGSSSPAFSSKDFSKAKDGKQHIFEVRHVAHNSHKDDNTGDRAFGLGIREDGDGGYADSESSNGKNGKDAEVSGQSGKDSGKDEHGREHSINNHESSSTVKAFDLGMDLFHHRRHHHRHGRPSHLDSPKESAAIFAEGSVERSERTSLGSPVSIEKRHKHYKGKGTYYKPGMGACGHNNDANDLIAALDQSQYSGGSHCGRHLNVCHQNKCVQVQVVDECPGCAYGSLDLSPSAFSKLAPKSQGVIGITWSFSS